MIVLKYWRYIAHHQGVDVPTIGVCNCWVSEPMPHDVEQRPWFVRWIDQTWINERHEEPHHDQ